MTGTEQIIFSQTENELLRMFKNYIWEIIVNNTIVNSLTQANPNPKSHLEIAL